MRELAAAAASSGRKRTIWCGLECTYFVNRSQESPAQAPATHLNAQPSAKKGAELILLLTPALSTQYPAQCGMKGRRFEVSALSPFLEYG
jgi:hypothetical protein